ncbi:hypothetical protein B4U79_13790 [Dinothrombium tinctorium]|uniref:Uncharacterized protein n=1 Tax=Dinothrombium tinctorium TaxID=1965070 RepID=A0A3S3P517_9ACAR|nr:hypothetical protein B4U79_10749 [Dinothrombium tinctorium]RWS12262.1 hypothetical protein B4U79_02910 [Dinothrombium tinctorium]RWS12263.1 hypothetical protein B4U79_13790 [Dinothrombium tinctorium]
MQRKSDLCTCAQLQRDELEDKFFRLKEEHQLLKKEANDADHKVKILNAKLSRLINEKKKLVGSEKTKREVQLEELVYDLKDSVERFENENMKLRNQLLLLRTQQQAEIARKRSSSAYASVRSRVDSGLSPSSASSTAYHHYHRLSSALSLTKRGLSSATYSALNRVKFASASGGLRSGGKTSAKVTAAGPSYSLHLLREAQSEIKTLEEIIIMQQSLIESLLIDNKTNQAKMQNFKESSKSQANSGSKSVPNDVDRDASAWLKLDDHIDREQREERFDGQRGQQQNMLDDGANDASNGDLRSLQTASKSFADSGGKVSEDMYAYIEKLRNELAEEKRKNARLEKQLLSENVFATKADEFKQKIQALQQENEILRNSFENCIGTCLSEINLNAGDGGGGNGGEARKSDAKHANCQRQIKALKAKVKQLESDKLALNDVIKAEKQKVAKLRQELRENETKISEAAAARLNSLAAGSVANADNVRGDQCNRKDHQALRQQLNHLRNEREELLKEFGEMKQLLGYIQNNIEQEELMSDKRDELS